MFFPNFRKQDIALIWSKQKKNITLIIFKNKIGSENFLLEGKIKNNSLTKKL
jgi:hypothetical protein